MLYLTTQATGRCHFTELITGDALIIEQHKSIGGELGVGYHC